MEEEEAGEAEVADRPQLSLEPRFGLAAVGAARVALGEVVGADAGELGVCAALLAAGVAVVELLGEVEAEPLGEAPAPGHRLGVFGEASRHRRRRGEGRARVAAPARLGLVEGLAKPDRDQGVLQRRPAAVMGVDVAGGDAGNAEALGEEGEPAVAGAIAAPVGALQLDTEAVAAESGEEAAGEPLAGGGVSPFPGSRHRPLAGAAREADEPLGVLLDLLQRRPRLRPRPRRVLARMCMRQRQQPTQVPVPRRVFHQQRQMPTGRFPSI